MVNKESSSGGVHPKNPLRNPKPTTHFKKHRQSSHVCRLCSKEFPSMQSLSGHMRCHPDREWRGIQPPAFLQNEPPSGVLPPTWAVTGKRSRRLLTWGVTAKRGRRQAVRVSSSPVLAEEELKLQAAASVLMSLKDLDHWDEGTNSTKPLITYKRGMNFQKRKLNLADEKPIAKKRRIVDAGGFDDDQGGAVGSTEEAGAGKSSVMDHLSFNSVQVEGTEVVVDVGNQIQNDLCEGKYQESDGRNSNKELLLVPFDIGTSSDEGMEKVNLHSVGLDSLAAPYDEKEAVSVDDQGGVVGSTEEAGDGKSYRLSSNSVQVEDTEVVVDVGNQIQNDFCDGKDQESDGRNSNEELLLVPISIGNGSDEGTEKVKLQSVGLDSVSTSEKYMCTICDKGFSTHQALGGHMSSHSKLRVTIIDGRGNSTEHLHQSSYVVNASLPNQPGNDKFDDQARNLVSSSEVVVSDHSSVHQCNKSFPSGQALGGHKRCHWSAPVPELLGAAQAQLMQIVSSAGEEAISTQTSDSGLLLSWLDLNAPPPMDDHYDNVHADGYGAVAAGGLEYSEQATLPFKVCRLCGKEFPSMQSLFGHMRCHPDRERRGIQPPASLQNEPQSGSSSVKSLSDDERQSAAQEQVPTWAVTTKRGRCQAVRVSSSPVLAEDEENDEEKLRTAVSDLMSLKDLDFLDEVTNSNKPLVTYKRGTKFQKRKLNLADEKPIAKKRRTVDTDGFEAVGSTDHGAGKSSVMNLLSSNSVQVEDTEVVVAVGNQIENDFCEGKDQESDGRNSNKELLLVPIYIGTSSDGGMEKEKEKVKLQSVGLDSLAATYDEKEASSVSVSTTSEKYTFTICDKGFSTHQALGGHMSSHSKLKVTIIDGRGDGTNHSHQSLVNASLPNQLGNEMFDDQAQSLVSSSEVVVNEIVIDGSMAELIRPSLYDAYQVKEDGSVAKIRHGETFDDHMRYFEGL